MKWKILVVVALTIFTIVGGLIVRAQIIGVTVAEALAKKAARDALEAQSESVGLYCSMFQKPSVCKNMISRAEKNPALKNAFQATQAKGVSVWPRGMNVLPESWPWFSAGSVETGWVYVNTRASDEAIIAFLTN